MNIIDENGKTVPNVESKRIITGILAIFFGSLGIHKFVLGYTTQGIILLALTVITFGVASALTGLIGLIEGIIYLTKSDDEFVYTYQINKRAWF
ncbi:TM2 domain-containing protein [Tenacibaculum sp. IB213877]|uniref:TM2 domain-containing protein n=1 Tax=Tenacibaculum sp. IB213877 TaxID=3097351 RepID=UPI002A5A09CB|nr:TM2 domain-containing protein [Tenacibaculum sp. IB213877]MDY0781259.1 TM2 domain-containing protein [Tenacibaculum sp. IB213877]